MRYSVVTTDDLSDNRILYGDGNNPSGLMVTICHIIQWAASGKKRNVFPKRAGWVEPTKPGFVYRDPKERPEAEEWR